MNLPVCGWAGEFTQEAFGNKHLHLLYVACFSGANTHTRRHTWEQSRRQIRRRMYTQSAFIAGGNNRVLLLRGQPQFCGQGEYIQETLLLYMFITLPWKNKRLSRRHFLSPPLPSHLSEPVWEGGGERQMRPSTCHTSSFSEIGIQISLPLLAYILSQTSFTTWLLFLYPARLFAPSYCLDSCSWPLKLSYLLWMLISCNVRHMRIQSNMNIWRRTRAASIVCFDLCTIHDWLLKFLNTEEFSLFHCCIVLKFLPLIPEMNKYAADFQNLEAFFYSVCPSVCCQACLPCNMICIKVSVYFMPASCSNRPAVQRYESSQWTSMVQVWIDSLISSLTGQMCMCFQQKLSHVLCDLARWWARRSYVLFCFVSLPNERWLSCNQTERAGSHGERRVSGGGVFVRCVFLKGAARKHKLPKVISTPAASLNTKYI